MRKGDPYYWTPSLRNRIRLWWLHNVKRKPNATCDACGYRGVRTFRGRWCPACWEDEGGTLIRDRKPNFKEES